MVKKQKQLSLLCVSLISLVFATDASARLNTWSNYYSPKPAKSPNWGVYAGVRGYASMFSSNKLENQLKGKSVQKKFYREIYESEDGTDKWLTGNILTEEPKDASYESVTVDLDMSNSEFTTKELDFQMPGFSAVIGAKLGGGLRMELEAGTFTSASSSGGLFTEKFIADLSSLTGGTNTGTGGGTGVPPQGLAGLDNYELGVGIGFEAELSKSIVGLNLIYDIDIGDLKPFIGIGFAYTAYTTNMYLNGSDEGVNSSLVGGTFVEGKSFVTEENKFDRLTYSLMGGFSYPLSDLITAEIGYKHTFGGNIDWSLVVGEEGGGTGSSKQPVMRVKNAMFQEVFFGLRMNF